MSKIKKIVFSAIAVVALYFFSGYWPNSVSQGRIMLPDSKSIESTDIININGCGDTFPCPRFESTLGTMVSFLIVALFYLSIVMLILSILGKNNGVKNGEKN